jgi:hypothetical protein
MIPASLFSHAISANSDENVRRMSSNLDHDAESDNNDARSQVINYALIITLILT